MSFSFYRIFFSFSSLICSVWILEWNELKICAQHFFFLLHLFLYFVVCSFWFPFFHFIPDNSSISYCVSKNVFIVSAIVSYNLYIYTLHVCMAKWKISARNRNDTGWSDSNTSAQRIFNERKNDSKIKHYNSIFADIMTNYDYIPYHTEEANGWCISATALHLPTQFVIEFNVPLLLLLFIVNSWMRVAQ